MARYSHFSLSAIYPVNAAAALLLAAGLSLGLGLAQPARAEQPAPAPAAARATTVVAAPQATAQAQAMTPDQVLDGLRKLEVASISDAIEQVLHKKMYMHHDMRPLYFTKFAGFATTVLMKEEENTLGAKGLAGMIDAIDKTGPNQVFVMVVPNGLNYAGAGGEMGTALKSRGVVGAVIDGGVRDTPYLTAVQFPVFARSIVPSTTVNHYVFQAADVPVVCDGVPVSPGDYVIADNDGVVVVPRAEGETILKKAQDLDFTEHTMDPLIQKLQSLKKAVDQYGRI